MQAKLSRNRARDGSEFWLKLTPCPRESRHITRDRSSVSSSGKQRSTAVGSVSGSALCCLADCFHLGDPRCKLDSRNQNGNSLVRKPRGRFLFFTSCTYLDLGGSGYSRGKMEGGLAKNEGKRSWRVAKGDRIDSSPKGQWCLVQRTVFSLRFSRSLFSRAPSRSIMEACTEIPAWPAYPLMRYTLCGYVCAHICTCSYIWEWWCPRARVYLCVMFSRELRRTYSDASNERGIRKQGTLRDWASFVRHDGS